ncbi:unnamed protein product, partial [Strongylus vulgaris]
MRLSLDGETSASSAPVDVVKMDYSTDFPKLPEVASAAAKPLGAWSRPAVGTKQIVHDAHARLVRDLQTQASRDLEIPKDHHRKLIGKEGTALRQLEADTNCRITIP